MEIIIFILLAFAFIIYFLPTIIAYNRESPNLILVFLINLFLGWSIIGWFLALFISLKVVNPDTLYINKDISIAEEIEKFAKLKEQGILTEEEFIEKKKELLNK